MTVISDHELSWAIVKGLTIVTSSLVSLLLVAWVAVRGASSKQR